MQRRFKISVEGHDYLVVVEEMPEEGVGLYPDRGSMRAAPVQSSRSADVTSPAPAAGKPALAAGPGDVVSPIAGVVLTIEVDVGAQVEAETRVASLEAMKTKTIVTAGRAGKVSAIAVSVGQGVEAGQALLTIA